jgi:hypothetical protein
LPRQYDKPKRLKPIEAAADISGKKKSRLKRSLTGNRRNKSVSRLLTYMLLFFALIGRKTISQNGFYNGRLPKPAFRR